MLFRSPIVNAVGYRDAGGTWAGEAEDLSQEAQDGLNRYDLLLYNHVFDAQSWSEDFFTLG